MYRSLRIHSSRHFRLPQCIVRKFKILPCYSNLCTSLSFYGTQFAHNFWNLNLSDTISWRSAHEIWGNAGWRNDESSVLPNLTLNCTHQIFINNRQPATPHIIVHIVMSIKWSHPSLYHWTAHGMFSIHVTKLTMNFSRFHVLRVEETDYRPYFTCGGILS